MHIQRFDAIRYVQLLSDKHFRALAYLQLGYWNQSEDELILKNDYREAVVHSA